MEILICVLANKLLWYWDFSDNNNNKVGHPNFALKKRMSISDTNMCMCEYKQRCLILAISFTLPPSANSIHVDTDPQCKASKITIVEAHSHTNP